MSRYCTVLGCENIRGNTGPNISYHLYPRKMSTRLKWIWATGRQYWEPPKFEKICSEHFKKEDFDIHRNYGRYLKEGAVPTVNVYYYGQDKETISDSDDDEEPTTSTDCQSNTKDVNEGNPPEDDDDRICVEPSSTKPNPAKDKTTAAENSATLKRKKLKLTQCNDNNVVHKLEVPNDEFQMFANNIAAQLRTLPLDVALNLQTEMHKLVAKERSERYRMSQQVDAGGIVEKIDNNN